MSVVAVATQLLTRSSSDLNASTGYGKSEM
jgi:hypothetical protein